MQTAQEIPTVGRTIGKCTMNEAQVKAIVNFKETYQSVFYVDVGYYSNGDLSLNIRYRTAPDELYFASMDTQGNIIHQDFYIVKPL